MNDDIEELKARLLLIHDHDGNDLSVNAKRGLKDACVELDKLKRYEEREPMVQALIEKALGEDLSDMNGRAKVWSAAHDLNNAKL